MSQYSAYNDGIDGILGTGCVEVVSLWYNISIGIE